MPNFCQLALFHIEKYQNSIKVQFQKKISCNSTTNIATLRVVRDCASTLCFQAHLH